jgi:hypothetical protein
VNERPGYWQKVDLGNRIEFSLRNENSTGSSFGSWTTTVRLFGNLCPLSPLIFSKIQRFLEGRGKGGRLNGKGLNFFKCLEMRVRTPNRFK